MRLFSILLIFLSLLSFVRSVPTAILSAASTDMNDISFASTNDNNLNAGPPAYRCETSSYSPLSGDVLIITGFLRKTDRCEQTNSGGSQCKKLRSFGTASIGICAGHREWLQCGKVADVVEKLVNSCQRLVDGKWRTGGYIIVEHPTRAVSHKIIVYNTKDN